MFVSKKMLCIIFLLFFKSCQAADQVLSCQTPASDAFVQNHIVSEERSKAVSRCADHIFSILKKERRIHKSCLQEVVNEFTIQEFDTVLERLNTYDFKCVLWESIVGGTLKDLNDCEDVRIVKLRSMAEEMNSRISQWLNYLRLAPKGGYIPSLSMVYSAIANQVEYHPLFDMDKISDGDKKVLLAVIRNAYLKHEAEDSCGRRSLGTMLVTLIRIGIKPSEPLCVENSSDMRTFFSVGVLNERFSISSSFFFDAACQALSESELDEQLKILQHFDEFGLWFKKNKIRLKDDIKIATGLMESFKEKGQARYLAAWALRLKCMNKLLVAGYRQSLQPESLLERSLISLDKSTSCAASSSAASSSMG